MPRIKAKRRCCKDKPRCKRCPVVLRRMAAAGVAERVDLRVYVVPGKLSKKELKAFR